MEDSKWFLKSRTIWGIIVAGLGAFGPMAKVIGWDWPSEAEVGLVGESGYAVVSAVATFGGLVYAFYRRIVATVQTWVVSKPAPVVDEPVTEVSATDADNA